MKMLKKSVLLMMVFFCTITLSTCTSLTPEETAYLNDMLEYAQQKLEQVPDLSPREDFAADHILGPNPLFLLLFGNKELHLPVFPYESNRIATACMSQFESPPESSIFWDFAFVVRPNANLRAPIMHGDAGGGIAGMTPFFSMDFYNVSGDNVNVAEFFGGQIDKINQALTIVEQYQRKEGEDRGEYTEHLDDFKSAYRIEMEEPKNASGIEKQEYADAVRAAFKLFYDAYLTSLEENISPEDDPALIQANKDGTDAIIKALLDHDFVVKMGPRMFQDQDAFDKYFLETFWRQGYYGEGL
jgi:hypothetical protein